MKKLWCMVFLFLTHTAFSQATDSITLINNTSQELRFIVYGLFRNKAVTLTQNDKLIMHKNTIFRKYPKVEVEPTNPVWVKITNSSENNRLSEFGVNGRRPVEIGLYNQAPWQQDTWTYTDMSNSSKR